MTWWLLLGLPLAALLVLTWCVCKVASDADDAQDELLQHLRRSDQLTPEEREQIERLETMWGRS